jgi:hypothetical protein
MNVTEYLEQLFAAGVQPGDLPAIQPLYQQRIWQQLAPGDGPDRLADVIERLRHEGRPLPRARRQLDQRPFLGARLRPGADPDGAGQRAVP